MGKAGFAFGTFCEFFGGFFVDYLNSDAFSAENMHAGQPNRVVKNICANWASKLTANFLIFRLGHSYLWG